jgi:hypothetical protein
MPDISMCADEDCPSRFQCTRSIAVTVPDGDDQTYLMSPRQPGEAKHRFFWPVAASDADGGGRTR